VRRHFHQLHLQFQFQTKYRPTDYPSLLVHITLVQLLRIVAGHSGAVIMRAFYNQTGDL